MATVVFFHAHPDDESIFTGGTIRLLADQGHRVVVLYATAGELGTGAGTLPGSGHLGRRRRVEAVRACDALGVQRVVFLDHHDSGTDPDLEHRPWGAFTEVSVAVAAHHVASILDEERAAALVTYDPVGIYGHPDHVHLHRVGAHADSLAAVPTRYEATVDREHLHFVDTHVASLAGTSIVARPRLGSATVEIAATVDVRSALGPKFAAIAAHRSQVADDPTFGSADRFGEVYGHEWFLRHGEPGPIEDLVTPRRNPSPYGEPVS